MGITIVNLISIAWDRLYIIPVYYIYIYILYNYIYIIYIIIYIYISPLTTGTALPRSQFEANGVFSFNDPN